MVNPRRPFSATADMVQDMLKKIEFRSRLSVTGFVNNGNLAADTTTEDLFLGYEVLKEVSDASGIPVLYTSAQEPVLSEYLRLAGERGIDPRYIGKPLPIKTLMHRDWDRYTELGI